MWKSMDRTRKGNETTAESMRNDTKRGADKTSGSVGNGGQARAKPGKARESPGRRGRARGGAAEAGEARERPGRRGRGRGGAAEAGKARESPRRRRGTCRSAGWAGRVWCHACSKADDHTRKERDGDDIKGVLWKEQWGAGGVAGAERVRNRVPQNGKSRKIS